MGPGRIPLCEPQKKHSHLESGQKTFWLRRSSFCPGKVSSFPIFGGSEIGVLEDGTAKIHVVEVGSGEIGMAEVGPCKGAGREPGRNEFGPGEVG